MTNRAAFAIVVTFVALVTTGCGKLAPRAPAPTTTAPITDYRTLTLGEIEIIIADKTRCAVTLKSAGPNKYTGTRKVPGDTMEVPVIVTVEESRIVIETTGGGLTSRQVIDSHGLVQDDLR